jgi:Uncharacterized protein conserved in bacteria
MPFCDFLMLTMVDKIGGERTLSGIIHILRGRQSIQTIQDCRLFQVDFLYHVYDTVARDYFVSLAGDCRRKGWIAPLQSAPEKYILTESGRNALRHLISVWTFPESLKYTEWVKSETDFWLSLQLTVQALSEHSHNARAYLPVTRKSAVTETVRRLIFHSSSGPDRLTRSVLAELSQLFSELPDSAADLLTSQLSGYQMTGLTIEQAAKMLHRDVLFLRTLEKAALRQMMHRISGQPGLFPNLEALIQTQRSRLSRSARVTYDLLLNGTDFVNLIQKRQLSRGTIEDHIVEIALNVPDFDVTPYLPSALSKIIIETASRIGTRQLKPIWTELGNQADYFQIRLALAKEAVKKEGTVHGPS